MTIFQDACTSTRHGILSSGDCTENDEMYAYIEITERLIRAQSKPLSQGNTDSAGCGDENPMPPMRKSLFAHVPPYIIFQNSKNNAALPPEISRHLLWWYAKKYSPRIITSTVQKSGFKTTTNPRSNWCGTWCSRRACSQLKRSKNFSKVNHFPSSVQLSDKILLWRNFQRMKRKYGGKHFSFIPLTFALPEERGDLRRFMQRNGGIWIVKPPSSCAGRGIKVVTRLCEIPDDRPLIAQRYISKPGLIDGIKFDIRLYVLLTSIDPLRMYVYNEGLVRLATVKYVNHASTLADRFMHLTNTSVNKVSPNYKINNDINKCEGSMWSLSCLWKYLASTKNVDTFKIWGKMKDIAIKTVISAESSLVKAWRKTSRSMYNFYQLFGFDILLDKEYRPWLLEVNDFPSMEPDTPLCGIIKDQLAKDYLNLVSFHVPDVLTGKELKILRGIFKEDAVCYNRLLHSNTLTWEEKQKQYSFTKKGVRRDYLKTMLKNLTPNDVRVLIRHEDEITQTGRFEKIFPTRNTYQYFDFFDQVRYNDLLLHAWENECNEDRSKGIDRLRKLCRKKYHLS